MLRVTPLRADGTSGIAECRPSMQLRGTATDWRVAPAPTLGLSDIAEPYEYEFSVAGVEIRNRYSDSE